MTIQATRPRGKEDAPWEAKWRGTLSCGHVWTCAVCSARLRAERLDRVVRALVNGRGRWQMLTVTIRHGHQHRLSDTLGGLIRSWRKCRMGRPVQPLWTSHVSASVRSFEVTKGANGWHPHAHVLIRTAHWTTPERRALFEKFATVVEQEMGAEHVPTWANGMRFSKPLEVGSNVAGEAERVAKYLAKVGLEITGHGKSSRRGKTHWQIAADAAEGHESSVKAWHEFHRGTRGKRMIELDRRASSFASQQTNHVEAPPRDVDFVEFSVDDLVMRRIRQAERWRPFVLAEMLELTGNDPSDAFDARFATLCDTVPAWPTATI